MSDYFKSDGRYIYLLKKYCEFYIPMSYFDDTAGFAQDHGATINAMGIFNVGFFENGQLKEIRMLNLPSWITIYVYDSVNKSVKLPGDADPTPCRILQFYEGNKVMNSSIIQDSENCEKYLDFILKGKIPNTLPYDASLPLWRKNQVMNSVHLGVPSVIEELILSATYRYKNDVSQKFARVIGKDPDKISQYDYKMVNVRQICQFTSTFTAVTFEDIDSMITTSLNRTREKKTETPSPIEKVIKM